MAPRLRTGHTPWLPPPSETRSRLQEEDPADAGAAAAGGAGAADDAAVDDLDALLDKYSEAAQRQLAKLNEAAPAAAAPRSMKALRDAGLSTPLPLNNIGFRMMERMGFQAGAGLGRDQQGRAEPVPVEARAPRSGLGVHEGRKRAAEAAEQLAAAREDKRARQAAVQYQQYQRTAAGSFSGRRVRAQLKAAWAACEALDARAGTEASSVLRRLGAREAEDGEEGNGVGEGGEEGEEEQLPPEEQLAAVVGYLREVHCYCTFCGCQYGDEEDMAGHCPGPLEDDH